MSSSASSTFDTAIEQACLGALNPEVRQLQDKGLHGSGRRRDRHLRSEWRSDSFAFRCGLSKHRFDEPRATSFEMCAHSDAGHTSPPASRSIEGPFDKSVECPVKCFYHADRIREFQRHAYRARPVPWPYDIDSTCRGPCQGISTVLTELCDE